MSGNVEADANSRRTFLRTAGAAAAAFVIAGCTSHKKEARRTPTYPEAFGGKVDAGSFDDIMQSIKANHAPHYVPTARAYVSPYPAANVADAEAHYPDEIRPALDAGVVVLYQRCTHLGCRVPFCASSQWFECPCHSAKFDRVGEYRHGPAPRGLDLMPASIEQGHLIIDTATIVHGLPPGTNTTHQEPAGPFCVGL